ncbi:MAG: carbohydrate kinase, partial [Kiritimatiellae bacterium]|nr:carbohydrate kinase [Kiritimatiellia bacterium]
MSLIAGLDVGTTGCKVTVFSAEGENLGREYRDYAARRGGAVHEVDAEALAKGVLAAVSAALARFGRIDAIGVTTFGEAFVLTDAAGRPLRPILLCTDSRGADEAGAFAAAFGAERAASISGVMPSEAYSFPKMLWVKAHEPEIFARARYAMLVEDYVIYLLTGERVIDYSLVTRTGAFDLRRLDWSREILEAAGLSAALFSRPVPTGAVAGLTPAGTRVIAAGHDQVAGAAGAGVF